VSVRAHTWQNEPFFSVSDQGIVSALALLCIEERELMNTSISCVHRIVNGCDFETPMRLKQKLECPDLPLVS
jgi:hypothetical protein